MKNNKLIQVGNLYKLLKPINVYFDKGFKNTAKTIDINNVVMLIDLELNGYMNSYLVYFLFKDKVYYTNFAFKDSLIENGDYFELVQ